LNQEAGNLQVEISMFRNTPSMDKNNVCLADYVERLSTMSPDVRAMFPMVESLLRLLMVNPASSATAERSFSSLRRLKTYIRSTMGQSRLNHVAICHTHKNILDEINVHQLMKEFVNYRQNRCVIFGNISEASK